MPNVKVTVKISVSEDGSRCGSSVQCQCLTCGGEFCQAFFCAIKNYKRCQKCIDAEDRIVVPADSVKYPPIEEKAQAAEPIDYAQLWKYFKAIEGGHAVSLGDGNVIHLDALMDSFVDFMGNPKATKVLPHEVKL